MLLLNLIFFVCHIYGRLDGSLKQRPKNNVDWQISRKARSRGTTEWWWGWIWQNPVCQESNDLLCTFYHFVLSLTRFTIERIPISNSYWKVMVITPSTVGLHTFYMILYYVLIHSIKSYVLCINIHRIKSYLLCIEIHTVIAGRYLTFLSEKTNWFVCCLFLLNWNNSVTNHSLVKDTHIVYCFFFWLKLK